METFSHEAYGHVNQWYLMCYPPGVLAHTIITPVTSHEPTFKKEQHQKGDIELRTEDVKEECRGEESNATQESGESPSSESCSESSICDPNNVPPPSRRCKSDERWSVDILGMKCKDLNKYIKGQNLSLLEKKSLKAARRRYLNRASARRNRINKKMLNIMNGVEDICKPKKHDRTSGIRRRSKKQAEVPDSFNVAPACLPQIQDCDWEEVEEVMTSESFGNDGLCTPVPVPRVCGYECDALDFTSSSSSSDDLQVRSPRFFVDMMRAVMNELAQVA